MLVLTRKIGEGIVIGDDITVTVIETKGGNVRVGIDAPRTKKIYRQEVYERISKANIESAHWEATDLDNIVESIKTRKK